MFEGTSDELIADKQSLTGQFLAGERGWTLRDREPRQPRGFIKLKAASGHNLKHIDVEFPLGLLCLVTGISGSGKSSLVQDTLCTARFVNEKMASPTKTLPFASITGLSQIEECMLIDQSPISRSPRSAPVTYVKAFDSIRKVFAETVEARTRNLRSRPLQLQQRQRDSATIAKAPVFWKSTCSSWRTCQCNAPSAGEHAIVTTF